MDFIPQGGIANRPLGYRQITDLSVAVGLGTIPEGTLTVVVVCETSGVRFRDDSVDPTTTVGFIIPPLSYYEFMVTNASLVKFIQAAPAAVLNILFYGR